MGPGFVGLDCLDKPGVLGFDGFDPVSATVAAASAASASACFALVSFLKKRSRFVWGARKSYPQGKVGQLVLAPSAFYYKVFVSLLS